MMSKEHEHFEFGPFRLDAAERMLLRNGQPVLLAPKVFDTLVVLLRHRGHLLEKNQLMKEVWPDTFVEEVNLAVNISTLRKTLGESEGGRPFIETVPKRGYRFVAALSEVQDGGDELIIQNRIRARILSSEQDARLTSEGTDPAHSRPNKELATKRWTLQRGVLILILAVTALLIAMPFIWAWRTSRGPAAAAAPRIGSIAVLPFKPLNSTARDEYLELGLADDLINRLSCLKQVIVRPTGTVRKYTNENQDPLIAGKELRVDSVLEGNIQKLGDRVRVTATLWSVPQGKSLWSGQFDENLKDIFAVEDSISERVAEAVIPQLSGDDKRLLVKRQTESPQAHDDYLKGRYFWNKRTEEGLNKAITYFQRAIDEEPGFARAYSGMADCYVLLYDYNMLAPNVAVPRAKAAALKAIEIDNTLAEPHSSLAYVETLYDWNWQEAEKEFRTAIALNGNYSTAHHWYGLHLAFEGRFDESLEEIKRAQQLDPLSLPISSNLGRVLCFSRRYDQAIEQLKATVDLDQNFWGAHYKLAEVYQASGRYQEAITEYEKSFELDGDQALAEALRQGYADAGYQGALKRWLARLQEKARNGQASSFGFAEVYTFLGNNDQALSYLDKALNERTSWVVLINSDPTFDRLRSDPRFQQLLRREGLTSAESH